MPLVRGGADAFLPDDPATGRAQHTVVPVYSEMLRQITRDYSGLPNVRRMPMHEIRFWYEGLRPELKRATEPPKKTKK